MHANDTLIIGVKVNTLPSVKDTIKLTSDLLVGQTKQYTLTKHSNISNPGTYAIKAFTLIEKEPYYYYPTSNDTGSLLITVFPNPVTGFPDTLYTARIDTLQISAIDSVQYDYYWQGSATPGSHIYYPVPNAGKYYIRVVNNISLCETSDSVYVKALIPDVGVDSILTPANHCGYEGNVYPEVRIKNFGKH